MSPNQDKQPFSSFSHIQKEFIQLCNDSGVKTTKGGKPWVLLDKLWYEVDRRERFLRIAIDYVEFLLAKHSPQGYSMENTVIVSPDTISSSYGSTPIVLLAAERLGLPFAIWQEQSNIIVGKPALIGTERQNLNCIVLQDVINHGTTMLRMLDALESCHWKLLTFGCFVLNSWDKNFLKATNDEYRKRTNLDLVIDYLIEGSAIS